MDALLVPGIVFLPGVVFVDGGVGVRQVGASSREGGR
jgi:hypothetical protein